MNCTMGTQYMPPAPDLHVEVSSAPIDAGDPTNAKAAFLERFGFDALLCAFIAIISVFEFKRLIRSPSFSPEYAQFFWFTHHRPFSWIINDYLGFRYGWYRPTQFFLPFWIGDHFLSWHKLAAWRYGVLATMLAVCFLVYAFVLQLLPGHRRARFLRRFISPACRRSICLYTNCTHSISCTSFSVWFA